MEGGMEGGIEGGMEGGREGEQLNNARHDSHSFLPLFLPSISLPPPHLACCVTKLCLMTMFSTTSLSSNISLVTMENGSR